MENPIYDYPEANYKEIIKTDNFRLLKADFISNYPYLLQWFSPAYGYETIFDLSYSHLAELIELFNKYTEEK